MGAVVAWGAGYKTPLDDRPGDDVTPPQPVPQAPPGLRRLALWTLLLAAVVFLLPLGSHGISDARESHLGGDGMDTLRTGQWMVVWDREAPRLKKPPLSRWMVAASLAVGGNHPFWLRLPGALCMLVGVLLLGVLARRIAGREVAVVAMVLYVTTTQVVVQAWVASAEQLLTWSTTAALLALWCAHEECRSPRARALCFGLAGLALGAGVLAKGPVAPLLVLLPLLGFACVDRGRSAWRSLLHPALWLGLVVVVGPWLWALLAQYPHAPEVWRSEAGQHSALGGPARTPMAFKWFVLAAPWVLLACAGVFAAWHPAARPAGDERAALDRRGALFALWWLLGSLVAFTVFLPSRSHYFTPVLPAVALLAALGWAAGRAPGGAGRLAALTRHAVFVAQPLVLGGAYLALPVLLWLSAPDAPQRLGLTVGGGLLGALGLWALGRARASRGHTVAAVFRCAAPIGLAVALYGVAAFDAHVRPGSFEPLADYAAEAARSSGRVLYRLEDRLANTPISTRRRLSREFDFYLDPPARSIGPLDALPERLAPGHPELLLLTSEQLEQVEALPGVRARVLGPRARDGGRHGLLAEVEQVP